MADSKLNPDDGVPADAATEELVAYLDGELDAKTADSIANRLGLDPKLRAEADALQRAWDILDILPRPQPSATFTTRTLSLAIPAGASGGYGQTVALPGQAAATTLAMPLPAPSVGFWLASIVVILFAGAIGYFAHRELAPSPRPAHLDPSLEDVPMMKNMRLYRHVDDIEMLKKLDSPELFAEE